MDMNYLYWSKNLLIGLFISFVSGCSNRQVEGNPFSIAAEVNPSLSGKSIASSYREGQANDYLLMSGSQLNQGLILGGFDRFMVHQRGSLLPEKLRDNFTALGYFVQNTGAGVQSLCDRNRQFVALAAAPSRLGNQLKEKSKGDIICGDGHRIYAIPLGYDAKVFAVSPQNSFATSIDLEILAKASQQANGNLLWSDIDSDWPSRPVRWVFAAQMPFVKHMEALGIQLPRNYLLASTYTQIFDAGASHPDALIYTHYSPSLNARLQGHAFKILPVAAGKDQIAIAPSPATINSSYPAILKTDIVLYVNPTKSSSCIAIAFAGFLLEFNRSILTENNMAPLEPSSRGVALKRVHRLLESSERHSPPYCQQTWRHKDGISQALGGSPK